MQTHESEQNAFNLQHTKNLYFSHASRHKIAPNKKPVIFQTEALLIN